MHIHKIHELIEKLGPNIGKRIAEYYASNDTEVFCSGDFFAQYEAWLESTITNHAFALNRYATATRAYLSLRDKELDALKMAAKKVIEHEGQIGIEMDDWLVPGCDLQQAIHELEKHLGIN